MTVTTVTLDTLRRFDRPGPRYTSYPTAVEFNETVGEQTYLRELAEADRRESGSPLAAYVHLPFCRERCHFCACNVVTTPHTIVAARYLDYLKREITAVAAQLTHRRTLSLMHWGGGTPTYFSAAELEELFRHITQFFAVESDAELAIEIDPRVTTFEQLETLARLRFNRLSVGVQDFTEDVQVAIGRGQTFEQTARLLRFARSIGFKEGINFDLIYGLPRQTSASFNANLDQALELAPDRLALYSFAFVPWGKPNQRRLPADALPAPALKLELYLMALERLAAAGYVPIGMDHFALPTDELAIAARERRLQRNFMGYTVTRATTLIGLGVSAIGDLSTGYFQNNKKLSTYYRALDGGRLPIERGRLLDADDLLRREVIMQMMCNFRIDKNDISARYDIDFDDYFAASIDRLVELEEEGLVRNDQSAVALSERGRLFVRNAAMAFDRYLSAAPGTGAVFSRTV
jgi:oxygen-independent coproporphyrinogen-3 oxidase